jgi:2'-5' RNA ligase
MSSPTQTAVIVTVASVEALVAEHRKRFDVAAGWGVPAHVTVLYPFVAPDQIDGPVVDRLRDAVASVPRFRTVFASTRWFGDEVLFLDPGPGDGFRALTSAVTAAFPAHLPYGGAYPDVVPHLTVGHDADVAELRAVDHEVQQGLPVAVDVVSAALWSGAEAACSWHQVTELPLG